MEIEIVEYSPALKEDFVKLNVEWLEKYFEVEAHDREQLENPETEIMDKGGKIFFAKAGDRVVGTASLIPDNGELELAKMAVTETSKGLGIGNLLMEKAVSEAKAMHYGKLILLSNRSLTPAISLYRKYGFTEVPMGHNPYARGNIKMEKKL